MGQFKEVLSGWVIVTYNHGNTAEKFIYTDSFRTTRKECIESFIEGTKKSWKYWYNNYNFRCVKAKNTIETLD